MDAEETRKELEATIEARRELGPGHDEHLIQGFLDRIERRLDHHPAPAPSGPVTPRILGSIALGIPVTAVALSDAPGTGGIVVAVVAWVAIGAANIVATMRRR